MNILEHLEKEHGLNAIALMNLKNCNDEDDLVVFHNHLHKEEKKNQSN